MNYLNAVFWDYPEFIDPDTIRRHLSGQGNLRKRRWIMKRFLENGRVVDTLQFFRLDSISQELAKLNLKPYTYRKWERITEVYAQTKGK